MIEAWYYFTRQLAALDPAKEPDNPAPAQVWKEADNVYWVRIGSRWANIETGEFRTNDRETYINATVALVVFSIVALIVELTKGY